MTKNEDLFTNYLNVVRLQVPGTERRERCCGGGSKDHAYIPNASKQPQNRSTGLRSQLSILTFLKSFVNLTTKSHGGGGAAGMHPGRSQRG